MAPNDGQQGVEWPFDGWAVGEGMCVCEDLNLVEVECFRPICDGAPWVARVGSYVDEPGLRFVFTVWSFGGRVIIKAGRFETCGLAGLSALGRQTGLIN
jgi:hypothetical protein